MRMMILALLGACTVENTYMDPCITIDDYVVCDMEVNYDDAWEMCANHESTLIDFMETETTVNLDKFSDSQLLGAMEFDGMWWVAGWENSCAIQLDQVVMDGVDCLDLNPFICEKEE